MQKLYHTLCKELRLTFGKSSFKILKLLTRPITHSTCILAAAILRVTVTIASQSWARPLRNGGILSETPGGKISSMRNPLSAMITSPASNRANKLLCCKASLSVSWKKIWKCKECLNDFKHKQYIRRVCDSLLIPSQPKCLNQRHLKTSETVGISDLSAHATRYTTCSHHLQTMLLTDMIHQHVRPQWNQLFAWGSKTWWWCGR